jgi:hypothetical protein
MIDVNLLVCLEFHDGTDLNTVSLTRPVKVPLLPRLDEALVLDEWFWKVIRIEYDLDRQCIDIRVQSPGFDTTDMLMYAAETLANEGWAIE